MTNMVPEEQATMQKTDRARVKLHRLASGIYRWVGPTYTVWVHKIGKQMWEVYSGDRGRGEICSFKTLTAVRHQIEEKGDQF